VFRAAGGQVTAGLPEGPAAQVTGTLLGWPSGYAMTALRDLRDGKLPDG
jgi:hypothetical protein